MQVIQNILRFLDTQTSPPQYMGIFHIVWIALTVVAAVVLCVLWKKEIIKNVSNAVLVASLGLMIVGLYKMIVTNFVYEPVVEFVYDWNSFPWHFMSIPAVIGLFIGATSGNINKNMQSYFATYGLLAGLVGMFAPGLFVSTVGLNVYNMLFNATIIALSVLILVSQQVRIEIKTFVKALPVFAMVVGIAISFNELAHLIFPWQKISMFSISRHYPSDTPIYSLLHNAFLTSGGTMTVIEYLICIVVYFAFVSALALLPLLLMIGIKKLVTTDFDAEYEKSDDVAIGIRRSEGLDGDEDSEEIFRFRGKVNSKKNTYVQTYFKNLHTNFGNNSQGTCGYVALSMLLSYYDTILSDKIVPRRFDKVTISHNNPNLKESPGTKFYQPPFDPSQVTYKEYIAEINKRKNTHLHEQLMSIGLKKHVVDVPDDENDTVKDAFGINGVKELKKIANYYLKKVADVKGTEFDIHTKTSDDGTGEDIRSYAIRYIRKGYPVLLCISNRDGADGHAVIAYDYDKVNDEIYCHFGYKSESYKVVDAEGKVLGSDKTNSTHLTIKEGGYSFYDCAMVLDFNERKISHTHTNNYEVVVEGALFYYCPDGRYTTCDDLIVEFGKGKKDLAIVGVYGNKYRRDQLTVPETIGNVKIAKINKYAFENQEHIKRVVLSCNIPEIPKKTFEDCESLKTVVIPESVRKIGSEAFGECPALTSIMYLGTKAQWQAIKKHRKWDRKTGNYKVYCTDGVLIKLSSQGSSELLPLT